MLEPWHALPSGWDGGQHACGVVNSKLCCTHAYTADTWFYPRAFCGALSNCPASNTPCRRCHKNSDALTTLPINTNTHAYTAIFRRRWPENKQDQTITITCGTLTLYSIIAEWARKLSQGKKDYDIHRFKGDVGKLNGSSGRSYTKQIVNQSRNWSDKVQVEWAMNHLLSTGVKTNTKRSKWQPIIEHGDRDEIPIN